MSLFLVLMLYSSIYLPRIRRIQLAIEVYAPMVVPVATAAAVVAFIR